MVRVPAEAKYLPLQYAHTGSGLHPTFCSVGTGDLSPGGGGMVELADHEADHPPHLIPRSGMSGAIHPLFYSLHVMHRKKFTFTFMSEISKIKHQGQRSKQNEGG